ncbi:MAG: dioxygenase [Rickettsiaceae bacterium H1]|nr:dioxygenase [Rickettsiaceae bacterium H1]
MKKLMLILLFFTNNLVANDNLNCEITPEIYHGNKVPKHFNHSNNLRRLTGSPYGARGKLIYISGKITDKNCVPVQGAIVSIWHFNAYGEYQYDEVDYNKPNIDKNFAGSGLTTTDNLGYYNFITIFPGEYTSKQPFINFTVRHTDFIPFDTIAFFSNKNKILGEFTPKIANRLVIKPSFNNQYEFNITLNGKNAYRKF